MVVSRLRVELDIVADFVQQNDKMAQKLEWFKSYEGCHSYKEKKDNVITAIMEFI